MLAKEILSWFGYYYNNILSNSGLQLAWNRDYNKIQLESDSLLAVQLTISENYSYPTLLANLINDWRYG